MDIGTEELRHLKIIGTFARKDAPVFDEEGNNSLRAFMAALDSMGKDPLPTGEISPSPDIVRKFFNDSNSEGDEGETDARGPWNEAPDIEYAEAR